MKIHRFPLLICLCILLFLPGIGQSSLTYAQALIFEDFFDDPSLPDWQHADQVYVEDGVLVLPEGGFAHHPENWSNFNVSFRAEFSGNGELIIQYKSGYQLLFNGERFLVQQPTGEAVTELSPPTPHPIPAGEWFQVEIFVEGELHFIQINRENIYTLILPEPLPPGGIAFEVVGDCTARIDDVSVINIDLEAENPPEPAQDPDLISPESEGQDDPVTTTADSSQLTWVRTGGPPGGLGYDIRYNFDNPDIWYVTDNYAGVHISHDNGLTWQQGNQGISPQGGPSGDQIAIFCLTVDQHDPQIVWSGTDMTGHIYKSSNGGESWVQKDNGVEIEYEALSFRGFTVDPLSSDIVYAMGETTGTGGGDPIWIPKGGVVYKTTDGGENWTLIWDGDIPSSLTRYLWVNPKDTDILYVSTGIFDRGAVGQVDMGELGTSLDPFGGLGVLKSTDGGENWRTLGKDEGLGNLYVGSLFMDPEDPDILLAATGHNVPEAADEHYRKTGSSPLGVYRTTDGGESWTQVIAPLPGIGGEFFTSVEYCPSNSQIVYAGSSAAVYRSSDSGITWETMTEDPPGWAPPGGISGNAIDMQCDPRNPDRIFSNNYQGGNYLSEDGGKTWKDASDGYTGAQIINVAVDPDNPATVYSSGRNGVFLSTDAGQTWQGILNLSDDQPIYPEWGAVRVDPSQPGRVLLGVEGVYITDNQGQNWSLQMIPEIFPNAGVIEFAPSNPRVIYMGGAGHNTMIYIDYFSGSGMMISTNGGESWENIAGPEFIHASILDIGIDPHDPETVYAATQNGLFKSTNSGGDWRSVLGLPEGAARTIGISPENPDMVFTGIENIGFYLSQDGGSSWQQIASGLEPNGSHRDLVFDPTNPQIVYLADLLSGMYRSSDGGLSWVKINNGLSTRAVTGLSISSDGQHLYAGTNGEGVFRLDLSGTPPAMSTRIVDDLDKSSTENPNAATDTGGEEPAPDPAFSEEDSFGTTTSPATLLIVGITIGLGCGAAIVLLLKNREQKRNEKS